MKLNESAAWGWGTAALMMVAVVAGTDGYWPRAIVGVAVVALAYRAGRDSQRSGLVDYLPDQVVSLTMKGGKLVDLQVKP